MSEQIVIIIEGQDKGATAALKGLQENLRGVDQAGNKTATGGLSSMVSQIGTFTGAVGIAGVALSQLYTQVNRGAELQLAADRFDVLAESIGTTADALINKLGAATGGMLSNAEQISLASQLIDLGLAKNEEMVIRLSTVIAERGLDMQQVIMTFANDSKMRLDALGLSVTDVDARTKAFQATGMAYTDAFDLAVLEALEAKVDAVGSAADTNAGSLKRLEANVQDALDAFVLWVSNGLTPAADALNTILDWNEQIEAASTDAVAAVRDQAATYEEYVAGLEAVGTASGRVTLTQEDLARGYANGTIEATNFERAIVILTKDAWEADRAMGAHADTLELIHMGMQTASMGAATYSTAALDASQKTQDWADNTYYAEQALALQADTTYVAYVTSEKFADRLQLVNEKAVAMGEAMRATKPPVDELMDSLNQDISSPLGAFIDDLQFFIASGGQDFAGAFQAIKEALASEKITAGEAQEFSAELLASIQNVKVAAGEITFDEAAATLAETLNVPLADAVRLLGEVGTAADVVFGLNREISLDTSGVESAYNILLGMEDAVRTIEGSHDVTINVTTNGNIPTFTAPGAGAGQGQGGTSAYGFDTGGIVPGTFAQAVPAVVHGTEMILNPTQQGRLFALLNGEGGSVGGVHIENLNVYANGADPVGMGQQVAAELGRQVRLAQQSGAARK